MDPSVGARHGIGRVRVVDPDGASLGSQTQAFFVLSPRAPLGHSRGWFELFALPRPWFLTTEGVELCRLPQSLGLE